MARCFSCRSNGETVDGGGWQVGKALKRIEFMSVPHCDVLHTYKLTKWGWDKKMHKYWLTMRQIRVGIGFHAEPSHHIFLSNRIVYP